MWDFEQVYGALHDFATGYPFVPDQEDYLVHVTTGTHVVQICLFLLAESRHIPARLIQASPPPQRRPGAPGRFAIIDLDLSKYDRLASRFMREQREGLSFLKSGIDTRSLKFNRLIERIEQVALASRAPLLLMGPTGAGKSRLARRIFELKKARRQVSGDFVELNCATLRGDAAMSALFGHRKGAFTGAVQDRPGLLRAADRGVLFLDEIGELGADEQAMLLRALEHKTFLPLGADREVRSEFQLLAGTNRDLPAATRQGRFREDLLARINLWTFELPGLADRPEDIAPNLDYELAEYARTEGSQVTFNREARDRFLDFAASAGARWTGNFRDFNAADRPHGDTRRTAGASRSTSSKRKSRGCTARGAAEVARASNRSSRACSGRNAPTNWIASIGCSSKTCCACAARVRRCRRQDGCCSACHAPRSGRATTRIACANISRASAWSGSRCARCSRGTIERTTNRDDGTGPLNGTIERTYRRALRRGDPSRCPSAGHRIGIPGPLVVFSYVLCR